MDDVVVYYLFKSKSVDLHFADGEVRTFAPKAIIPQRFVANLLDKWVTVGGCCGKPEYTVPLFATEEQMQAGERKFIDDIIGTNS